MLDHAALSSWESLGERLGAFIGRRLPAQDVEDVLQDVLLRIHTNASRLDDETRFGPWVYSIARNAIVDHLRRRGVRARDIVESPRDGTSDDSPLLDCVAPFVARLPSPYRQAITLVEMEHRTTAEAAKMEGISVSGMKSRVQRGRRMMRALFEECCHLSIDARGKVFAIAPKPRCGCER